MDWTKFVFGFLAIVGPLWLIIKSKSRGNEELGEKYDYFYSFLKIIVAFDLVKWATYFHAGHSSPLYHFLYYVSAAVLEAFKYYVLYNITRSVIDEDSYKGLNFSLRGFFVLALPIIVLRDVLSASTIGKTNLVSHLFLSLAKHTIEFNLFLVGFLILLMCFFRKLPLTSNTLGITFGLAFDTFCNSHFFMTVLTAASIPVGLAGEMRPAFYLISLTIFLVSLRSYVKPSLEQQVYVDMRLSRIDQYLQRKFERLWIFNKFAISRTIK